MKQFTLALGLLGAASLGAPAAAAPGVVVTELPAIIGAINEDLVIHTLSDHRDEIQKCYEDGLEDRPELAGAMTVKFLIGEQGEVTSAEVRASTLGDDRVEGCVLDVFYFMDFPQPYRGRPYAIYKISFQPKP